MIAAVPGPPLAIPKVGRTVAIAVLMGLLVQVVGTLTWVALIRRNMREHADSPWAAMSMACFLVLMLTWLSGVGWPRRTSAFRRYHLRLWRPQPGAWSGDGLVAILGLVGAMVMLSVMYVLIGASRPPADVSAYSTAVRWSILLMGPTVAGVVEEAAFRGYMQSHLERIGPTFAILVTSANFALLHASQGLTYLLAFGPGIFIASVVYGQLALKSGSILPGMVLHISGDMAYAYVALFGGDPARLFAN